MAAKKGKKAGKRLGKKDLKRTKGGLLPAVNLSIRGEKPSSSMGFIPKMDSLGGNF